MSSSPPELRFDPLTGGQVIVAPGRSDRPHATQDQQDIAAIPDDDPFAEGNERFTPHEVYADRPDHLPADGPGWRVRVVPNRYPALATRPITVATPDSQTGPSADPESLAGEKALDDTGLFVFTAAKGVHEVIVECPERQASLAELPAEQLTRVLIAWRERIQAIRASRGDLRYALLFKNHLPAAGASLPHAHSQLMATAFVPREIENEHQRSRAHHARTRRSLLADVLRAESRQGQRLVSQSSGFVVWCPFASRFPYQTCIAPKSGASRFESSPNDRLSQLATHLKFVLQRYAQCLHEPGYNVVLHNSPLHDDVPGFTWHLELYPRISGIAGFELGGGEFVNIVAPEFAASVLKAPDSAPPDP